jgi:hypothetical protein
LQIRTAEEAGMLRLPKTLARPTEPPLCPILLRCKFILTSFL